MILPNPKILIQFYEINEDKNPAMLKLDRAVDNLLPPCSVETQCDTSNLTAEQLQNYNALELKPITLLASAPACPGDGNGDWRGGSEGPF